MGVALSHGDVLVSEQLLHVEEARATPGGHTPKKSPPALSQGQGKKSAHAAALSNMVATPAVAFLSPASERWA
jgi:hypothetical protein